MDEDSDPHHVNDEDSDLHHVSNEPLTTNTNAGIHSLINAYGL